MRKHVILFSYILLGGLGAYLLFYNLGGRVLWADEAETALLARNINRFGVPRIYDGKNTVSVLGPAIDANDRGLWTWAPWLDKYIAAASFKLGGESTLSARLPFAAAGFAAFLLAIYLAWLMYGKHKIALLAGFMLCASQMFILHSRQCRYYSILILGQVWLLFGLWQLAGGKTRRGAVNIALALALQFYSNYTAAAGNIIALVAACAFFGRKIPGIWKGAAGAAGMFTGLVLPWVVYARVWAHGGVYVPGGFWSKMGQFAAAFNFWVLPLALFAVPLAAYEINRSGEMKRAAELKKLSKKARKLLAGDLPQPPAGPVSPAALFVEKFIWLAVPVHLAVLARAPLPVFLRYICFLSAPAAIAAAALLVRHVRRTRAIAAVTVLFFCTNLPHMLLWPWRGTEKIGSPFLDTMREIGRPYEDRLDGILAYFKANATPAQSVYTGDPEFGFIFYTGMKVINANFAGLALPDPLPDWIFADTASGVSSFSIRLPPAIAPAYERVDIAIRKSRYASAIPEPAMHERFTAPDMTVFTVYRKK
ncbi:MAG: hypothetical protein PHW69_09685 [Elusimicrobiaceae bacterium]|nr:hypothetical protein [Elusimicrobiaceae bacterium]